MAEKKKCLELKKNVGAIHSSNALSLLQRKIANVLLYHAYDELMTKDEHEIHIGVLCKMISYDSNDHKTIKRALVNLLSTVIEWNLIDGNKIDKEGIWSASSIIADASIDGAICTYSYSNKMKKFLHRPELYGRLNMVVQAKFQSNYGLALYENCIRYQDIGQTPWFTLEKFRRLMGIGENKYKIFRDFKRRVIDSAVIEVNKFSHIVIVPQFRKQARTVVAIQFLIKQNSDSSLLLSSEDEPKKAGLGELLQAQFGLSRKQKEEVLTRYDEIYIKEKIAIVESSTSFKSGKIKNIAKYLLCALKDDYQLAKASSTHHVENAKNKESWSLEKSRLAAKRERESHAKALNHFMHLPELEKNTILKSFAKSLKGIYLDIFYRDGIDNYQIQRELLHFIKMKMPELLMSLV